MNINMILAIAWPFNKIQEWFEGVVTDIINGIISLVELAFSEGNSIMNDSLMTTTFYATQTAALMLVVLLSLRQIINIYLLETDGDAESDPIQVLVRNSKATLIISAGGLITNVVVRWADDLCSYVTGASSYSLSFQGIATTLVANIASGGWFTIIFIGLFAILLFVYAVIALIRGVELGMLKIVLPIMACDLTSVRQEKWNNFVSAYLVVAFGYIIQVALLKLAMTYGIQGDILSLLKSIVCMYFGVSTPHWLEKFTYSSGLKNTARSGAYMAMMLGRGLK